MDKDKTGVIKGLPSRRTLLALLVLTLLLASQITFRSQAVSASSRVNPRTSQSSIPAPAINAPSDVLTTVPSGEPTTFIAQWRTSQGSVLESFSALNGAPLGDIATLPSSPAVSGPYRAGANNVWITTTGGPEYTSNVMNGDPKPYSCNATVSVLDPTTHLASVVLATPHSEFVIDAVPNADGQRYAYLVGNCTSYEKQHVVIANLANSSTVSIGLNTTRCHFITKPAWSSNGSQLTFSYSPPTLAKNTFSAQGGCQMPLAGEVAIVPTSRSSVITTKELTKAPPGCSYAVSAFNSFGVVAVETCGALGKSSTYLTQMNGRGTVLRRYKLQPNSDPTSLSVTPNGLYVLVNEYQARALADGYAIDWVWVYNGHSLRFVAQYQDSNNEVRSASW